MGNAFLCCESERPNLKLKKQKSKTPEVKKGKKQKLESSGEIEDRNSEEILSNMSIADIEAVTFKERLRIDTIHSEEEPEQPDEKDDCLPDDAPLPISDVLSRTHSRKNSRSTPMGQDDKSFFKSGSNNVTPRGGAPLIRVEESDVESIASSVHPLAAKSQEEKLAHLSG